MKKYVVLAVMLIIPACLFLFLKFQGKNHFQLEVIVPVLADNCNQNSIKPDSSYQLPEFSYSATKGKDFTHKALDGGISILHLVSDSESAEALDQMNELQRVQSVIVNKEALAMFTIYGNGGNEASQLFFEKLENFNKESNTPWELLSIDFNDLETFSQCAVGLGLGEAIEANLVLLDKKRRIRGFYDGREREEIDRLITELQVLEFEYKK